VLYFILNANQLLSRGGDETPRSTFQWQGTRFNDDISVSILFSYFLWRKLGNKKHNIIADKPAKAESLVVKIQRLKETKNL
jgi:hypothetical protein